MLSGREPGDVDCGFRGIVLRLDRDEFEMRVPLRVGVDSYCYHRLSGEIYPNQIDPEVRWDLAQCIDEVVRIGAEGISLETRFMPSFEGGYLSRLKERRTRIGLNTSLPRDTLTGWRVG